MVKYWVCDLIKKFINIFFKRVVYNLNKYNGLLEYISKVFLVVCGE